MQPALLVEAYIIIKHGQNTVQGHEWYLRVLHRWVSKQTTDMQLVGKGRAGWEQYLAGRALEPSERVTGTGSPSPVCVFTAWFCLWVI